VLYELLGADFRFLIFKHLFLQFKFILLTDLASSNFIDHVRVYCRSGAGGAGSVHFRQEKFAAFGGPDGGNGGRGGHLILRGNAQFWTLLHLKYQKHIRAENGKGGTGAKCSGAQGKDVILDVPIGTVARIRHKKKNVKIKPKAEFYTLDDEVLEFIAQEEGEEAAEKILANQPPQEVEFEDEFTTLEDLYEEEETLVEVVEDGQEIILLPGGRGGLGNYNFRSPTNQAPRYAQPGGEAGDALITLELKLLADIGLVGFPNAGKSTLLSVLSAAKPEIADYPFTTLVPNLGVVSYRGYQSFVMADIPGIIEGAAEGRGLGIRFLRHIERNSALLFMISAESDNINATYQILLKELEKYNPELLDKKRLLAITKSDLLDDELKQLMQAELTIPIPYLFISAATQQGLTELKDMIMQALK
jgi:GTP-binding protein